MSDRPVIDGFEFAAAGSNLHGRLAVASLSRLYDLLDARRGEIAYEVSGRTDRQARARLVFAVKGSLRLRCQRCLEAIEHALDLRWELLLARSETQIAGQQIDLDAPDWALGSKEMGVLELIEDELLLRIPDAPRHEVCSPPAESPGREKRSPFEGLQSLIRPAGAAPSNRGAVRTNHRK